jgi:hypothetical protein
VLGFIASETAENASLQPALGAFKINLSALDRVHVHLAVDEVDDLLKIDQAPEQAIDMPDQQ